MQNSGIRIVKNTLKNFCIGSNYARRKNKYEPAAEKKAALSNFRLGLKPRPSGLKPPA